MTSTATLLWHEEELAVGESLPVGVILGAPDGKALCVGDKLGDSLGLALPVGVMLGAPEGNALAVGALEGVDEGDNEEGVADGP